MNIQSILDNASSAMRAKTLENSPQLTLGELLTKLESIPQSSKKDDYDEEKFYNRRVEFEFEGIYPTGYNSWRGAYKEIALGFSTEYRDGLFLDKFIEETKGAIGKTYGGYKGGDFTMNRHTPVWVANYGNGDHNGIVDVTYDEYTVKLITKICEF